MCKELIVWTIFLLMEKDLKIIFIFCPTTVNFRSKDFFSFLFALKFFSRMLNILHFQGLHSRWARRYLSTLGLVRRGGVHVRAESGGQILVRVAEEKRGGRWFGICLRRRHVSDGNFQGPRAWRFQGTLPHMAAVWGESIQSIHINFAE